MARYAPGTIAVIFTSQRTGRDAAGYAQAAAAMDALAARQPGYCGIESTRDAAGFGITISYWASDAAAIAWRDDLDHCATRDRGRAIWYAHYTVVVAAVTRSYEWSGGEAVTHPSPAALSAR